MSVEVGERALLSSLLVEDDTADTGKLSSLLVETEVVEAGGE